MLKVVQANHIRKNINAKYCSRTEVIASSSASEAKQHAFLELWSLPSYCRGQRPYGQEAHTLIQKAYLLNNNYIISFILLLKQDSWSNVSFGRGWRLAEFFFLFYVLYDFLSAVSYRLHIDKSKPRQNCFMLLLSRSTFFVIFFFFTFFQSLHAANLREC